MADAEQGIELTIAEQKVMRTEIPRWYDRDGPRICLLQLQDVDTANEEVASKIRELTEICHWDSEYYDELAPDTRPENTDPRADVRMCGLGGCTLRIFQAENGSDIQVGACKAADYCLRERFEAVTQTETILEGQALYRDIMQTCEEVVSETSAGNLCPKLDCGLSAGVSIDMIPGTAGTCSMGEAQTKRAQA